MSPNAAREKSDVKTLKTERLVLRMLREDDLDDLFGSEALVYAITREDWLAARRESKLAP